MKKIILGFLISLGLVINFSFAYEIDECANWNCNPGPDSTSQAQTCTWIKLNTNVPFIWNCIRTASWSQDKVWKDWSTTSVTQETAFPLLISALTKFVIGVIMLVAFWFIVVWGLKMTMEWASPGQYKEWKDMIMKAVIAIALIWLSWIILNAINPNFFKT